MLKAVANQFIKRAVAQALPASNRAAFFSRAKRVKAVPREFPTGLPKVDQFVRNACKQPDMPDFSDVMVLGVQHFLGNTALLLKALRWAGIPKDQTLFTDKVYSTDPRTFSTFSELVQVRQCQLPRTWQEYTEDFPKQLEAFLLEGFAMAKKKNLKKVLIIDDGARALEQLRRSAKVENWINDHNLQIVGVEQTTAGCPNGLPAANSPVIAVGTSFLKVAQELPQIGSRLLDRAEKEIPFAFKKKELTVGIAGAGGVGCGIANALQEVQSKYDLHKIILADICAHRLPNSDDRLECTTDVERLIEADIIFGCTGGDLSLDFPAIFEERRKDVMAISGSSELVEFELLLRGIRFAAPENRVKPYTKRGHAVLNEHGARIEVVAGGFPLNLVEGKGCLTDEEYAPTAMGLFVGTNQAANLLHEGYQERGHYKLSSMWQKRVLEGLSLVDHEMSVEEIAARSGGDEVGCERLWLEILPLSFNGVRVRPR